MPESKYKKRTYRIEEKHDKKVKKLAKRLKVSESEVIRLAIIRIELSTFNWFAPYKIYHIIRTSWLKVNTIMVWWG